MLGSILTLVATSKDVAWASVLLVVYAIGAALPMLAIAYGGQAATTRVRSIARYSPRLRQAFGAIDAIPSPYPVW
jgi:cytochrome c-type biogenesis protein